MNGYGPNVGAIAWFFAYYFAWAMVLMAIARLLLVRGTDAGWRARLQAARGRLTPAWFAFAGLALAAWIGLGAFILSQHQRPQRLPQPRRRDALQAEFERSYKQYEKLPQPRIVAAEVHVDLYPERGHMRARGTYSLVNRTTVDVTRAPPAHWRGPHRSTASSSRPRRARSATTPLPLPDLPPRRPDAPRRHRHPDASTSATSARASATTAAPPRSSSNGSFFNNAEMLPGIGYSRGYELERRRPPQGAGPPPPRARPRHRRPRGPEEHLHRQRRRLDRLRGQRLHRPRPDRHRPRLPAARVGAGRPPLLRLQDGQQDPPLLLVPVGPLRVLRDKWKDVDIEIYYQPGHEYNLARMVDAVKKSLDYFTRPTSAPTSTARSASSSSRATPASPRPSPTPIPFSESIGFIARVRPTTPTTSTTPSTSPPTRSPTSGGPTRSSAPTSRAPP
jgi:ABC-2 type transport system permease protein